MGKTEAQVQPPRLLRGRQETSHWRRQRLALESPPLRVRPSFLLMRLQGQQVAAQVLGLLPLTRETRVACLAPGLSPPQSWLLKPYGE